jgi:hypothetical protein
MIHRDWLVNLLEERNFDEILEGNLKKISTGLITFLYEDDFLIFRAGEALGLVCSQIEKDDEEFVKIILRRLFWHLNDESGAYCRGAPVGIGEIGRTCTFSFEGFKNMLVSLLDNEEVELKFVIYAIGRASQNIRDAYPDPVEKLLSFLSYGSAEIRGYTAWALGEFDADTVSELQKLKDDLSVVRFYDGEFREKSIKEIVEGALNKIKVQKLNSEL